MYLKSFLNVLFHFVEEAFKGLTCSNYFLSKVSKKNELLFEFFFV